MAGKILNRAQIADALAVHLTTIDDWLRKGMPFVKKPSGKGGASWKIDLSQAVQWLRNEERRKALGEFSQIDEFEARRRKMVAEAALAEYELAERQRSMIRVEDAGRLLNAQISACRAKLLGLGPKLAPMVAGELSIPECESIISSTVHETLADLSQLDLSRIGNPSEGLRELPPDSDDRSKPVRAASGPDGKRVGRPKQKAKPGKQRRARPVENKPGGIPSGDHGRSLGSQG